MGLGCVIWDGSKYSTKESETAYILRTKAVFDEDGFPEYHSYTMYRYNPKAAANHPSEMVPKAFYVVGVNCARNELYK